MRTKLLAAAIAAYMRLVYRTSRVIVEPSNAEEHIYAVHPFILAMWHGQFLMMPTLHTGEARVSAIAARHGDAAILSELLPRFRISVVRGSGAGMRKRDRGGVYALRSALKILEGGATFSLTADVPGMEARRAGEGIVTMARHSGRPIVPFAVASKRFVVLKTWSRMTINLPFSTLAFVIGDPIWVPAEADDPAVLEKHRRLVEDGLNKVTRRAYELAGGDMARVTPPRPARPGDPLPAIGWQLRAYRAMTGLLSPIAPLLLRARERQGKEDRARLAERFGEASAARPAGPLVWMHAASVGESNAILPLIERLRAERPDLAFVLTTGTVTSAGLAQRRLGPNAVHQYVPLDAPGFVKRFLDHWRPDLVAFTESEIWPNLILEVSERRIPLALVNARISSRSFQRWKQSGGLGRQLFSRFDLVLAQNAGLTRSFSDLGARRVVSAGNLKFDAPPPPVDMVELDQLRTALAGRPIVVAASTHEGEEEIVARAHRLLARDIGGLCTIIAPRHPERGTAVAELAKSLGLRVAQRSTGALPGPDTDLYVADTIGELGTLYALARVAFIGGSLVDRGGQNPIEAIGHGAVVLTGPHWRNFRDAYRALIRLGGAREVRNAEELATAAAALLTDDAEAARMRTAAGAALESLSGALEQTVTSLLALLAPNEGIRRAS